MKATGWVDWIPVEITFEPVVTEDQWPFYLNFARRVFSKCLQFTGQTLEQEKESLKQEYMLRGYVEAVLDQIIAICQALA